MADRSGKDVTDKISQPCSEEHLAEISNSVADWRAVSPFLGLTEPDEIAILESTHSIPARRMAMLRKWKQKQGPQATYDRLCQAFRKCNSCHLEQKITELLVEECSNRSNEAAEGKFCFGAVYMYISFFNLLVARVRSLLEAENDS